MAIKTYCCVYSTPENDFQEVATLDFGSGGRFAENPTAAQEYVELNKGKYWAYVEVKWDDELLCIVEESP